MKRSFFLIAVILIATAFSRAGATGKGAKEQSEINTRGMYAGGQASTNGLGFNFKYILSENFTLKAGYERLGINRSFMFSESDIDFTADLDYKTGGLFVMADWFYTPSLYLSGGVIANNFQPQIVGYATSDVQYGDITIPASDVGDFNLYFEPEVKTSPYMAVGFRKFLGKSKRVSYNFETGLYYMGSPDVTIQTTGLLEPTSDEIHGKEAYMEDQFSAYKYYPVVKMDVAVRLF